MTEPVQLEGLLDEKTRLEGESRDLDVQQKQLEEQAKQLSQQIIQALRNKNNRNKENVDRLKLRINELEEQLGALSAPSNIKATDPTTS
jgi:seryl-tRNA synthetase